MASRPDVEIRIGAELAEFKAALGQAVGEVRKFAQEAGKAGKAAQIPDAGIGKLTGQVQTGITAVKGLVAAFAAFQGLQVFAGFVKQGVEFNKTLETSALGIASLIAAQSDLVDAQGKTVQGQDALTVAIGLAEGQMQKLRIAGLETAATTTQLVEAFQQAIGPGLAAGLGLDEVRTITVQIVQAAGALGVPMNQVAQEVRAILDGSIDINARVAKSLGITNEMVGSWREQGKLVEELNKRMEAFTVAGKAAADNLEVIKSNAAEVLDAFAGEVTTGYFDSIKTALKDATTGIFDTKTLGIAEPFKDLASVVKEIIDLVGNGVSGAITGSVDLARDLSEYFKDNREQISEMIGSAGLLVDQFLQLVGSALQLFGIVGDLGVRTSAWSVIVQTIAVLIAGVRDGFRAIGAVITWLGSLIIKVVLAPLETLTAVLSEVVGLANKEAAAQLKNLEKQIAGVSARGFEAAGDLLAPIADGTGAVATAIKQIEDLQKKASRAGQEQKKAAGGATGEVAGTKGGAGKAGKFSLPDVQKELDESFRLLKDSLDRESRALDQALEDRRISIAEWYADKERIAEQGFANEKARLDGERAAQVEYLNKVSAAVRGAANGEDRQRAEREVLKAKNDIAKVDADLVILERERATVLAGIGRDAAAKEKEYQRAIEDTRTALLRAQGKDLDAQLAEFDRSRRDALERFKNDPNASALVDQLFDAQTLKARIDDVQSKLNTSFGGFDDAQRQIATKLELGILSQVDAETQLQDVRTKSIAQVKQYITALEALAATSSDPAVLSRLEDAKIKLAQMGQEQDKFLTGIKDAAQSGLTKFFGDLASGAKSFGDAMKDLVRNFAAAVGKMAAEALAADIMGALFKGGSSGTGSGTNFLSSITGWFAGLFHSGGIVGAGGPGRMVSPLVFAGAPRYHNGGMAGLKPNEVPAILQKGEEVLTANDPRHANNGGDSGSRGFRVVNVIDPAMVEDYMSSSSGEQVILNTIGRNPGYVKQILG